MLSCCYLPLTQKIVEKFGEPGKKQVLENHEVAMELKMIPAPALGKMRKLTNLWIDCQWNNQRGGPTALDGFVSEKIEEFRFISKQIISSVLFWNDNFYSPTNLESKRCSQWRNWRITDSVEDFHYGVQALFTGSHPGIWKLWASLQKRDAVQI